MIMQTKITNNTEEIQRYAWVPKHGLTLQPGQSVVIDGIVQAKRPRLRKAMLGDIEAGRVDIIMSTDMEVSPADKEIEVNPRSGRTDVIDAEAPKKKGKGKKKATKKAAKKVAPKTEKKEEPVVEAGDSQADANISVPPTPEEEINLPGVQIVEEDDQEPIFDERGNELPPDEPPVIVTNVHNIDPEDILAKNAAEAKEDMKVAIPPKEEVKALHISKVKSLAKKLDISVEKTSKKKDLIKAIDARR